MGEMRDRMEKELKLRGYSPRTLKAYVSAVHNFVRYTRNLPKRWGRLKPGPMFFISLRKNRSLTLW
jgi:hypothetical protein